MTKKKSTHEDGSEQPRGEHGHYTSEQTISPERQAAMQAGRTGTGVTPEELVEAAGFTIDTAPPELRIAAVKASKGDMRALTIWLQQTRQLVPTPKIGAQAGGGALPPVFNIGTSHESITYLVEKCGMEFTICPICDLKGLEFKCPHCGELIGSDPGGKKRGRPKKR
jgi:hypothetical protein